MVSIRSLVASGSVFDYSCLTFVRPRVVLGVDQLPPTAMEPTTMPAKSFSQALKGPPEVRLWNTLNPRRDGSPCVLERKFGYVKTRHENLAKAERQLSEVKALPAVERHPSAAENLKNRAENHRAWLMFSIQTLEQHCLFAVSRFDGALDAVQPATTPSGKLRQRGKVGGGAPKGCRRKKAVDVQRLVNYYRAELPTYLACCAVSTGTSGQNEAMKLLMRISQPVIAKVVRTSGREAEVAEQLAITYLFEKTAAKFNPADPRSNMAAFNTFFTYGAKRATQKRTKADAAPGEIKLPGKDGKFVRRGTLHSYDEDNNSDMFHPGTYDDDQVTRSAVANALSSLAEDEKQFAIMRFVEKMSLRQIADENEITTHCARGMEKRVGGRLRELLCDFAEE